MTLQSFSFPVAETRFLRAGSFIYKFKIRRGGSFSGEEVNQELEDIIRTVIGNLDTLQPFSSEHFNVFPNKKQWEGRSEEMCKHDRKTLTAYPFVLLLNLEKKTQKRKQTKKNPRKVIEQHCCECEPLSKCYKRDSTLEGAILKDLIEDMVADSNAAMVGPHVDNPHAEGEVNEDTGNVDEQGAEGSVEAQLKSGINRIRGSGSPGKVDFETDQDVEEEEEEDNAASQSQEESKSGILTRLASYIFPFSLFFRDS
ncbi:membrane-anchored junction protein isoform X1 [Solea solea]|uniref:membrane-anchored junction protein isoform X1 n=1 Tax=Solea solea TaxID=90069 RepID=UPI00272D20C7|nr:membrane-anchored junction protein isoform X1 [Solea solea]XP_058481916.1 membrane-anchored junction protein isoform X1 [Solea solea]